MWRTRNRFSFECSESGLDVQKPWTMSFALDGTREPMLHNKCGGFAPLQDSRIYSLDFRAPCSPVSANSLQSSLQNVCPAIIRIQKNCVFKTQVSCPTKGGRNEEEGSQSPLFKIFIQTKLYFAGGFQAAFSSIDFRLKKFRNQDCYCDRNKIRI